MQPITKMILEKNKLYTYPFETDTIFKQVENITSKNPKWKGIKLPTELIELFYLSAAEFATIRQVYTSRYPYWNFQ